MSPVFTGPIFDQSAKVFKVLGCVILSIITYAATIGSVALFFSGIGDVSHQIPRFVGGWLACFFCAWLLFDVYKGLLKRVVQITGGVIFGALTAFSGIGGAIVIVKGLVAESLISVFGGTFAVILACFLWQFTMYCFSERYRDGAGERHREKIFDSVKGRAVIRGK